MMMALDRAYRDLAAAERQCRVLKRTRDLIIAFKRDGSLRVELPPGSELYVDPRAAVSPGVVLLTLALYHHRPKTAERYLYRDLLRLAEELEPPVP